MRTFVQLHGYQLTLAQGGYATTGLAAAMLSAGVLAWALGAPAAPTTAALPLARIGAIIAGLLALAGVAAQGNAEFLCGLPAALALASSGVGGLAAPACRPCPCRHVGL